MIRYENINGIILAGGKSSRMGRDKAMLEINGLSFLDRQIEFMAPLFKSIIVCADIDDKYDVPYPVIGDIYKGYGPIGGIYTGLENSQQEINFIISVDIPFINHELIDFLVHEYSDEDMLIPLEKSKPQAHCGIYNRNCIETIEDILDKKKDLSLRNLLRNVNSRQVEVSEKPFYSEFLFYNLNTPDDYNHLVNIEHKSGK